MTGPRDIPPDSRAPGADDRGSREPGMGTLSGLDFAPRTRPRRTGSRPLGWWPWLLAFVLLATVLLGLFRKPLADQLWPGSEECLVGEGGGSMYGLWWWPNH